MSLFDSVMGAVSNFLRNDDVLSRQKNCEQLPSDALNWQ